MYIGCSKDMNRAIKMGILGRCNLVLLKTLMYILIDRDDSVS